MDRTVSAINSTDLRWYKHNVICQRKKSNMYTAFLRCACKEYYFGDNAHKRQIIALVLGLDMYPSDITCCALVKECWANMPDALKQAWKCRADRINSIPRLGVFRVLPNDTPRDRDTELRVCLRQECDTLRNRMEHLLKKEKNCKKTQNTYKYFPQKTRIGLQLYEDLTFSPYLRQRVFGERLSLIGPE